MGITAETHADTRKTHMDHTRKIRITGEKLKIFERLRDDFVTEITGNTLKIAKDTRNHIKTHEKHTNTRKHLGTHGKHTENTLK